MSHVDTHASAPVLVVGATGTIGRELVRLLSASGQHVRALVRTPDRGSALPPGVDWVVADLRQPATLGGAVAGVARLFVVTNDPDLEPTVIRAAASADVDLIVKVSALGPGGAPPAAHARAERALEAFSRRWVVLRPNAFMQTFATYLPSVTNDGTLSLPAADARTSWLDARDIAVTAAAVLTTASPQVEVVHTLTGPEALSMDDVAATLSAVARRSIRYDPMDPERAEHLLQQRGLPAGMAGFLAGHYAAVRAGDFATVTPAAAELAGQPGRRWHHFLADHPDLVAAVR